MGTSASGIGWGGLDWVTLGLFMVGMCAVVWWVLRQKEETSTDYFLAGRGAGWIAIGASLFASNIGSEHLVGLAGAGASSGMAMSHWELHAWLMLMLGWVFVPFYSRSQVFTMPEFLERRYNSSARTFLSIISLVSYVLTKVAVTVFAGGLVFKTVLGIDTVTILGMEIDFFWIGAISLVVLTGLYTVLGGMRAVLYTSVLQAPVLLIGSIVILFAGLTHLGGGEGIFAGWDRLLEICGAAKTAHGDSMLNMIRSRNDVDFPWTGVLLGSAIIGFWYWCTDQYIVQRVLSAPDQTQARRGTIFGAYLKLTPVFIFLIPGMIAYALHQQTGSFLPVVDGVTQSDAAFPTLVRQLLPVGIKGIVVGGLVAALMSSLASLFNSSATLFTVDFYKRYKPDAPERELVRVGRIATAVVVFLGIVWIPVMRGLGSVLYEYLQDVQSLISPGIAAAFFLGVFWKRTSAAGGLTGMVVGFSLGMFRLVAKVVFNAMDNSREVLTQYRASGVLPESVGGLQALLVKFLAINWLHYCIFLLFLCLAVIVVVSLLTKKPEEHQLRKLTYAGATDEEKTETRNSWNRWDVLHTVIIIGVIMGIYAYFW